MVIKNLRLAAFGAALILSAANAHAGESGVFLGIGTSFGFEGAAKAMLRGDQNGTNNVSNTTKALSGGVELLTGYKFFFTQKLGIRGYVSTEYSMVGFGQRDDSLGVLGYKYGKNLGGLSGLLDMNLNVDFMFEAMSSEALAIVVFAGLAGGFHLWHGGVMSEAAGIKTEVGGNGAQNASYDIRMKSIFGSLGLNLGLSFNLGARHAIEALSKIPFLEDSILSYKTKSQGGQTSNNDPQSTLKLSRPYSLAIRYIYTF